MHGIRRWRRGCVAAAASFALGQSACSLFTDLGDLGEGATTSVTSGSGAAAGAGGGTSNGGSGGSGGSGGALTGLGKAIQWNGGCGVAASDIDAFDFGAGEAFTLEFWLRLDAVSASQYQIPIWKGGSSLSVQGWDVELGVASPDLASLTLSSSDGTANLAARADNAITRGDLYHVVAVRSGATVTIYLLSATAGDSAHVPLGSTSTFLTSWTNTAKLSFGAGADNPGVCAFPLYGTLDEVRLWSIARDPSAFDADYNRAIPCNSPDLIGYWRFEEGTGNVIGDCSPTQATVMILPSGAYAWIDSPFDSVL